MERKKEFLPLRQITDVKPGKTNGEKITFLS
jgi:hypothetical protein